MAPRLVLFQELAEADGGSTKLQDQMYVIFQREVRKEEDYGRFVLRQVSEVTERLSNRESYIAEMEILGPRMLVVQPLGYMREIYNQETEKLNSLREALAASQVRLRRKWWEMQILTSVANIIEDMIKNGNRRQFFIESHEKVEDSYLTSSPVPAIVTFAKHTLREEELKALADPMEIMKDISEHLNLKHIFCENMKNM
ncbi:hypothetical protein Tco_0398084 [Tanacetum coccineum]